MHQILKLDQPNDFIVATGELHSVKEFSKIVFNYFGLDYKKYIKIDNNVLARDNSTRIGDSSLLRKETGWKPSTNFNEMIIKMAKEEEELYNEE
mgnify:FL=1